MISPGIFIALIALAIISIYTISYGIWTWKSKNRAGAVMVFLLAAAAVIVPLYKLFFRE